MKKRVAVLFGGQSSEHAVSVVSAANVIRCIDTKKYEILMVGITKEGHWVKVSSLEEIESGAWEKSTCECILSPDATKRCALIKEGENTKEIPIDVVFPVLHGLYGEDGTIQGLLELGKFPYVGCGVLSSSISMDKVYTKIIVAALGIAQANHVAIRKEELKDLMAVVKKVEEKLPYPVFIKPSNAGSSCGISKAHNRGELEAGILTAAEHDRKILVEETILGREVECAVLGGKEQKASGVGEILAAAEFYDYEAKYHNPESKTVLTPSLPQGKEEEIREDALKIFQGVDGFGLARVDFFLEHGTNRVVFNEINTLPGFTGISMYPMLWETQGIHKEELVEMLMESATER